MYDEPAPMVWRYLSENGILGRYAECGNCGKLRETFRSSSSLSPELRDGRLPSDGIPIALGRPGSGHKCDGCDEVLAITVLMMELTKNSKSFLLHGDC